MNDIVYRTLLDIVKKADGPWILVRRMVSGMEMSEKLLKGQERELK